MGASAICGRALTMLLLFDAQGIGQRLFGKEGVCVCVFDEFLTMCALFTEQH